MQEGKDYNLELVQERAQKINQVSPTFCMAKWLQSTVLLYNGTTHSCHHPPRHKIRPETLVTNPQGIHNTPEKMSARKELLAGKQTSECQYCWNIENLNKSHISDRIYKSTYSWSIPRLQEVLESGKGEQITPSYLEVAFESTCNCKCLYCNPESSSSWEQEIRQFGAVPQKGSGLYDLDYIRNQGALPIPQNENNPYIDAFWKWWPEIYQKLHVLRVTGGEPLLSKHTWKLLDVIGENPRKALNFSINSNLCLPKSLIEKLIQKIQILNPQLSSFEVYTSLETVGSQAEYVRYGMKYSPFLENCHYLLQNTPSSVRLHFMTTINCLSAPGFLDFLKLLADFRRQYKITSHNFRVRTFLNYLRWPECLSLALLPEDLKKSWGQAWVDYVEKHLVTESLQEDQLFYPEELEQLRRMVDYMNSIKAKKKDYDNFRLYIGAIDRRRKLDFSKTFPELVCLMDAEFYG